MIASESPFPDPAANERRYKGKHATAGFFHIIFKALAYIVYMFGGVFLTDSYITLFVIVVLFLAADFWTVKNVTGRLMVSLRWWNEIQEDGTNKWQFEAGDINNVDSFDSTFFWVVLLGHVVLWAANFIVAVMGSWKYLPLVTIALALGGANALGYSRCRTDARKRLEMWLARETVGIIAKNPELVTQAAVSTLSGRFGTSSSAPPPQQAYTAPPVSHPSSSGAPFQPPQQQPPQFYVPQASANPFSMPAGYSSQYNAATSI